MELLLAILTVISIGLFLRLRETEKRLDLFDKWADWLEEVLFNPDTIVVKLEGEKDGETKN